MSEEYKSGYFPLLPNIGLILFGILMVILVIVVVSVLIFIPH